VLSRRLPSLIYTFFFFVAIIMVLEKIVEGMFDGQVSAGSVDALERNAQWIEDEELKAAMLALVESLKTNDKGGYLRVCPRF